MEIIDLISKYLIYFILVIVMFVLDTVTGLSKAFYHKNYQSTKARHCFSKLMVYLSLIFAVILMEYIFILNGFECHFTPIISIAMCVVEFSSIGENFKDITGKNFITEIIDLIINQAKKLFNKGEEKNE